MKLVYKILLLIILTSCTKDSDSENNSNCKDKPTLSTQEVTNIGETSAKFSGEIIAPTCESTVTSQGFVFAKTTFPKTDDLIREVNGKNISSVITNLERNTKYYMRTFFVNPTGKYYGNQVEFKTDIGEIKINTKTIENISYTTAKSGVVINDDGGGNITKKGLCWNTSPNPTINDTKVENNSKSYNFDSVITGLSEDTMYYLRAFATNEKGTVYGNEETFKTQAVTYKVEFKVTGHTNSCNLKAKYFYYEINYQFDNNDIIFSGGEGFEGTSHNHTKEGKIKKNLTFTIHLGKFDPNQPNKNFKGTYLDNMSLVITNLATKEKVLDIPLPSLFICTDTAYKNVINFKLDDKSHKTNTLTFSF